MNRSLVTHAGFRLPPRIQFLETLSYNLWWCWNHQAHDLFLLAGQLARKEFNGNPIQLLREFSPADGNLLSTNEPFLAKLKLVEDEFNSYLHGRSWWGSTSDRVGNFKIAYFSAEFGLHESLPIYSGGLGVLAGDFFKATSDLGIPLIGVGLFYSEGYFKQILDSHGYQHESYLTNQPIDMPVTAVPTLDGRRNVASVFVGEREVFLQLWQVQIGRGTLFLVDTNCPENDEDARKITSRLYGGDFETRIRQEIVLGIGGMRALAAVGIFPEVCHMNEGHSAFLSLERLRVLSHQYGLTFDQALRFVRETSMFTTHTPVPAGHDAFHSDLMHRYFHRYIADWGISFDQLMSLGRVNTHDHHEAFSMTVLGMKTSSNINAVSRLHGEVSRDLWKSLWPNENTQQIPISYITNGVHVPTWVNQDLADLFDLYLGREWRRQAGRAEFWNRIHEIPDEDLWRIRSKNRLSLIEFARRHLVSRLLRVSAPQHEIEIAQNALNPRALTIGFARRFATYKRATLLLKDFERLSRIVRDTDRPVQFVFAGKAHPADQAGKDFIAQIQHAAMHPDLKGRFVFIEDYDMHVARQIVQGVDVWLNTPRRPLEASGTSGMKAAMNGALNLSILDGWWCEGFNGKNGWAIRHETAESESATHQHSSENDRLDELDAVALYELLEREVVPLFYENSSQPTRWIEMVKNSLRTITPAFSASRMAAEYATRFYLPHGTVQQEQFEALSKLGTHLPEPGDQKRKHSTFLFPSMVEMLRKLWH